MAKMQCTAVGRESTVFVWKLSASHGLGTLSSTLAPDFFAVKVNKILLLKNHLGTSLEVQWLKLCAANAVGVSSVRGQGTKIPHAAWPGEKEKVKRKKKSLKNLCFALFVYILGSLRRK